MVGYYGMCGYMMMYGDVIWCMMMYVDKLVYVDVWGFMLMYGDV